MTVLQAKLYQAAKREPTRRFHALYDRLLVPYVLQAAWELVRKNQGAAGIDQQTLEEIEALGVTSSWGSFRRRCATRRIAPSPCGAC